MPIFISTTAVRLGPLQPTSAPASAALPDRASVLAGTSDESLLAIFDVPVQPGETIELAYRRKEHDLIEAFARLSIRESMDLHRRLCNPRPDDRVAELFSRLVVQRRVRLLTFLIDARRRAALAATRR